MEDFYKRQEELSINRDQSVTVVGCGGIGFWVSKFLLLSGVRELFAYDPDKFEEHNLNRIDIPTDLLGTNKADVVKMMATRLRPDTRCITFPFPYSETTAQNSDWLVDCTDKHKSQVINQKVAKNKGMKYLKAGYDGENFSIHNSVAEWGEAEDGYVIIPSWVAPAVLIASMTVAKIMKYPDAEMVSSIKGVFNSKRI